MPADLFDEDIDVAFRAGSSREMRSVFRQLHRSISIWLQARTTWSPSHPKTLQELARHDCLSCPPAKPRDLDAAGPNGEEEVEVSGRFSANSARILMKAACPAWGWPCCRP